MKKYDERKVVTMLNRINGIYVAGNKTITIHPAATVGIHQWGRIDYLCNYCGYIVIKSA
jgi:hypothetical protein